MSSARVETSPQDFREILIVPDEQGNPPLVIGGQAVNLWANYYLQKEPELQQLGPFVSKDLDLLGDQQTVWRLAALLGQRPQRPPEDAAGPVLARFDFRTPGG